MIVQLVLPRVELQLRQLLPKLVLGHAVDVPVSQGDLFVHWVA